MTFSSDDIKANREFFANRLRAEKQKTDVQHWAKGEPAGGDFVLNLHRLYGDVNGDRFVNGADFAPFRAAFGTTSGDPNYSAALDVNGDGFINGADFAVFRINFGSSLDP